MRLVSVVFQVGVSIFCFQNATANESSLSSIYLSSREGDPASLVENVSTIHGDYTEFAVDLTVAAPDPLVLSRLYSSRDALTGATLGGWRFNPHCFLTIQKKPNWNSNIKGEEKFEPTYVTTGTPEGSTLTYVSLNNTTGSKKSLFRINAEVEARGLANTARRTINAWTNLKNNELCFDPESNTFELVLSSGGRRFYTKHASIDTYLLNYEILPSGNKIFYEFNQQNQLVLIKETNASEKKVLAWIKLNYESGVHVDTSDGKTVDYHFQIDAPGCLLLTQILRSDSPNLNYTYQVVDGHGLLVKKELPEGRYVEIDYYFDGENKYKVRSVSTPAGAGETTTTLFSYGSGFTEVYNSHRKTLYGFDENSQLTHLEHYLDGSLYRAHRKSWGKERDAANLLNSSIEDGCGNIFYYKSYTYDDSGNLVKECEYGNLTGASPTPLIMDENGKPQQEPHIKIYSYFSGKKTYGLFQKDAKGTGIKFWYKKGTNLLIKKKILSDSPRDEEEEDDDDDDFGIKKRYFYEYNEDAALVRVIVDDGTCGGATYTYGISERHITSISPKQELPNIGAPEIIDEKYYAFHGKEVLLKRMVNHFDLQGNVSSQTIYDAQGVQHGCTIKSYLNGLLQTEIDPAGNKTHYSYDANHNLVQAIDSNMTSDYRYDLSNRLIYTSNRDSKDNLFETHAAYDLDGNKISEIDRFGNETIYENDDLGRPVRITYPEIGDGSHSSIRPSYIYAYDIFDNPISVTDPKGRTTSNSYNIGGKPLALHYRDGTTELFKYDAEGTPHRHAGKDGIVQVFEYDYIGRLNHIEYYKRGSKGAEEGFKRKYYAYNTFHLIREIDERGNFIRYNYDLAGRLVSIHKDNQKVEFIYDALGRTHAVKKWKSSNTFTLQCKEYDLLNRVIEERIENHKGQILIKTRYVYNAEGQLAQVIGYPHNQENILTQYEYDGFGRVCRIKNAANYVAQVLYDDFYINSRGQRVQRRTLIDPLGNRTEEIFDATGKVIKTVKTDKEGLLLSQIESFYDVLGNTVIEKVAVISEGNLLKTYDTEWSFEQGGQLKSSTYAQETPDKKAFYYDYNTYGDVIAKYSPGPVDPITYKYSAYGNLQYISYKEGNKEVTHQIFYDLNKNITKVQLDSSQTLDYSYDENNLLVHETILDDFGYLLVGYTYNGEGQVQTLKLPDRSFIKYTYEGPLVSDIKRFNKDGKELYNHRVITRDLMGNSLQEILPGHCGEKKQCWDKAGRRTEINTDFFQDKVSEYDPLDNITKRETLCENETSVIDYNYNALSQLISENGQVEHTYSYDSLGNRLQKDNAAYTVNNANQLIETAQATYTFDPSGNLATKTINDKTWTYQWNPLNHLVSIEDPDQIKVTFTYDLSGRRLTKRIEAQGKKTKIFRYFYLGETEIGCLDEKGVIAELKIPGDPNNPEGSPSVAIEIKKEFYVPLYDLQGNIICLLDHQQRKIAERYRYSAFGEEEIIDGSGRTLTDSSIGNPWRFRGKRVDKELGLIYFGKRYYDPEVGRWISPDPIGNLDGPNLYTFVHNNPITYVDYFGLATEANPSQSKDYLRYFYGEYEPHCHCEAHRDCKRGGNIQYVASLLCPVFDPAISLFEPLSTPYKIGTKDLANAGIGFINGIDNTPTEAKAHALMISQYANGSKIQGIYNATHALPVDVLECVANHCKIATPPVQLLKEQWDHFISTQGPQAKFLQICHSGGAIHVLNALSSSPKDVRNKIIVLAISPGAIVPQRLCYRSFNYASKRDFVPKLDVLGNLLYGSQLISLKPHPDAHHHDHGFDSPTFQDIIQDNLADYLKLFGGIK